MNAEIARQLQFLAAMPTGSVVMKDFNIQTMLIETGGNMLARGSLYNFVVTPIGVECSRVTLALANPIPRAEPVPEPVVVDKARSKEVDRLLKQRGWDFFMTGPDEWDWLKFVDDNSPAIARGGDKTWCADLLWATAIVDGRS